MIMGVRIEQYTRGNGWNDGNEVRGSKWTTQQQGGPNGGIIEGLQVQKM